jgi:osmotically-inducible protein OsmY
MSDYDLERLVKDELTWDPKLDANAIAVMADDGVVTLRGNVSSFRQKREASKDAERVARVRKVVNKLDVQILDRDRRDDSELRGAVLQALMLDTVVPSTIDVEVADSFVTLTGTSNWRFERDEAEFVASNVPGVISVINDVDIVPRAPTAADLKHSIETAMDRNAKLDADSVSVESSNGTVTLRGTVSSWADHDEAVSAAWAAPGVSRVKDHILVAY